MSGITKGSVVWTTPITFVATANVAMLLGLCRFCDIDPKHSTCAQGGESEKSRHTPNYLVVVHFGGNPFEMKKIFKLSKRMGLKLLKTLPTH